MKMKTLAIGIPAFNEEANISFLVNDLLSQKTEGFKLSKIIVNSDGSTDKTTAEIKKINNKKIILLDHKKRLGRAFRQNQIMELANEDALVLIDADTLIKDRYFLKKITAPIFSSRADLTSARVEELEPNNFIEKILEISMKLKKYIFESINHGDNLYTCHGRSRAFSKKLYKSIKFTDSVAEDAYSYLYCISKNMKYKFVGDTEIFYKLPSNFKDHQKQSIRFLKSQEFLTKEFGSKLIKESYKLPLISALWSSLKFFIKKPVLVSLYVLVFGFMKISSIFNKSKNTWEISQTSKKLRSAT